MSHFLNAITQHYADFGGRARRKEYWYFILFSVLASWLCEFVDVVFNLYTTAGDPAAGRIGIATTICSLFLALPSLSIMVRRLHDTGRSGWFALAPYLPVAMIFVGVAATIAGGFNAQAWPVERIVGGMQVFLALVFAWIGLAIYVLILLCMGSEPGANAYGTNPVTIDQPDANIASPQRVDAKVCPRCAETVKAAARVCRFCGCEFEERTVGGPDAERTPSPQTNAAVNYASLPTDATSRVGRVDLVDQPLRQAPADTGFDLRAEASRLSSQHRAAEVASESASSAPPRASRAGVVPPLLFGQESSDGLNESPNRQTFAWALSLPWLAFIAAIAILDPQRDSGTWWAIYLVFAVVNIALMKADQRANNGFMTQLGLFFALTLPIAAIPSWLWTRGSVFKTTRGPFWGYLATLIIGFALLMASPSMSTPPANSSTSPGVSSPSPVPTPPVEQPLAETAKATVQDEPAITFTGMLSCTSDACQLNGITFTPDSDAGRAVLAGCKQDDLCRVTGILSNRTDAGGTLSSVSAASRPVAGVDEAIPPSSLTQTEGPAQTGPTVLRVGDGVEKPTRIREVKPQYTEEATKAKIQGTVTLDAVIGPDGTVTDVRVTRSLDTVFGLDEQARKAAFATPFFPCKRQGQPVACVVSLEMYFTLR